MFLISVIITGCSPDAGTGRRPRGEIYQMLLAAAPENRSEWVIEREGLDAKNMYDNYEFTIADAKNWLLQTGGDINFVLQMRHPTDFAYDNIELSAEMQYNIILHFLEAQKALAQDGFHALTPRFFIGSLETEPKTNKEHTGAAIYKLVSQKLIAQGYKTDMIAGMYIGEDSIAPNEVLVNASLREACTYMHRLGKKVIWIPYSIEGNVEKYKETLLADVDNDGRVAYDIVLMQYCTFYWLTGPAEQAAQETAERIHRLLHIKRDLEPWLAEHHITLGIHMEFDMGLSIGRTTQHLNMPAETKRDIFKTCLELILPEAEKGMALGLYSGGPNEQGYNDITVNRNTHNIGYYIPYAEHVSHYPPMEGWQ